MEVDEPLPPPEDRVEPVVLRHMPSATEEQEVDNDLRQLRSMLRKVRPPTGAMQLTEECFGEVRVG